MKRHGNCGSQTRRRRRRRLLLLLSQSIVVASIRASFSARVHVARQDLIQSKTFREVGIFSLLQVSVDTAHLQRPVLRLLVTVGRTCDPQCGRAKQRVALEICSLPPRTQAIRALSRLNAMSSRWMWTACLSVECRNRRSWPK